MRAEPVTFHSFSSIEHVLRKIGVSGALGGSPGVMATILPARFGCSFKTAVSDVQISSGGQPNLSVSPPSGHASILRSTAVPGP